MQVPVIQFDVGPSRSIIIVERSFPESDLQSLRGVFPRHRIVSVCEAHGVGRNPLFGPAKLLQNRPHCSVVLTPVDDDFWEDFWNKVGKMH